MIRSFESSGLFLPRVIHNYPQADMWKTCVLTDTSRTPNSHLLQHLIHPGRHLLTFNLVYVVVLAVKRMQRRELPA